MNSRRPAIPAVICSLLLALAASCSRDSDKSDTAATGEPAATAQQAKAGDATAEIPANSCRVKITGDETLIYTRTGDSASVTTEYWMTDDEIRRAVDIMTKVTNADLSEDQIAAKVEEAMKKDPKRELLRVNCSQTDAPRTTISLWTAPTSKYNDIPFSPKSYTIPPQSAPGQGVGAGELAALVRIGTTLYAVAEPGKLELTKFDRTGLVGTFSLEAVESGPVTRREGSTPKRITLEGIINFDCTMQTAVCKGES